ncbi:MAG: TonB-dependent receptor, partial [Acidobacteriaceae bacterium]
FLLSEEYSRDDRGAAILSPLALNTTYIGHATSELFLGRLDHQLNGRNQLSLRANMDRLHDTNPQDAVSGLSLPSTGRVFRRNTYSAALSLNSAINNTTANDARVQFQLGSPITQFTPINYTTQFAYPGFATIGNSQYASLLNHQYEAADTITKVLGHHTIKAGIDLIQSSSGGFGQEFGGGFLLGQFQVKPTANGKLPSQLAISDVSRFTQTFGNQQYNVRDLLGAVFVQDSWRATQNLNLELGLRYDAESFTDSRKNFAPRLGVAYKLPGASTVVRASYGIFYSEERTDLAASDKLGGPQGIFTFSAAPGQFGFPTTLTAWPAFPVGALLPPRDITVRPGQRAYLDQFFAVGALHFYPNALLNPYTQQWSASVEQDLGRGWLLTLNGIGQYTQKIERPVDLNAPAPFIRTAPGQVRTAAAADATRPILPLPNGYRRIIANVNVGQAWYDGLQVNARKRLSRRFTTLLSYTWSHTINTVEADGTSLDANDANLLGKYEKATSLLDQRHRVSLSGTYALPWGFEFGSWISAASARPFNATTGLDNNGDGSTADRPVVNGIVVPRNYGQGTPTYDIAAFLGKSFQLGERFHLNLRADGFNLTNHLNVVGRNGTYGNGALPNTSFGAPLAGISNVEPAKQFEFQARITF